MIFLLYSYSSVTCSTSVVLFVLHHSSSMLCAGGVQKQNWFAFLLIGICSDIMRYPSLRMWCLVQSGDGSNSAMKEDGRLIPERAIWQICHDISCGLFHIHSRGMVHYDIKPSNMFFVFNSKWGETICKIGDFELAGDVGSKDDGQGRVTLCTCRTSYSSWVVRNTLQFSLGLPIWIGSKPSLEFVARRAKLHALPWATAFYPNMFMVLNSSIRGEKGRWNQLRKRRGGAVNHMPSLIVSTLTLLCSTFHTL